ncbi:MAG: PAS domain S-box protein [Burkholderiales bacterium]|nr:PAS domain S-box protein [Bacteroidia bacterium]
MKTLFEIQDEFFKHLLNNFNDGIVILNSDFEITYVSDYILQITGYKREDFIEKNAKEVFPEDVYELHSIFEAKEINSSFKHYKKFHNKDGTDFTARVRYTKGYDINGDLRYIIYLKDNTPFQRNQDDIIRKAITIENLAKSRKIRNGELDKAILEILESASRSMDNQRINAWVFNEDQSQIDCIGNFDAVENKLVEQQTLLRANMPNYFKLFDTEKIIIASEALTDPQTAELVESYLKPHNIYALMDIPIRIEGDMIGVLCFEHTANIRIWNQQERQFGLIVAQMISLAIETNHRQRITGELKESLEVQKNLMKEFQHRVKNNFAVISSLINLEGEKAKDEYHKSLFQESRNRLDSIAKLHELLYKSKSYININLKQYLNEVLDNLTDSFSASHEGIDIKSKIDDVVLGVKIAIPLALILNELVTNSYKHAFKNVKKGIIEVNLTEEGKEIKLVVKDSGAGFDRGALKSHSVGLHILDDLVKQIDATLNYRSESGTVAEICLSIV